MRAKKSAFIPSQGIGAGFTLVELLVVISIIALLLGILTSVLVSARRIAYKTACKQNLHGCAIAFRMYLDENNNTMPAAVYLPTQPTDKEKEENLQPIAKIMAKHLSGPEALKCPADKNAKYFRSEGSSYAYFIALNNQRLDKKIIKIKLISREREVPMAEVPVMFDYDSFHGPEGKKGSVMYLYADNVIANVKKEN